MNHRLVLGAFITLVALVLLTSAYIQGEQWNQENAPGAKRTERVEGEPSTRPLTSSVTQEVRLQSALDNPDRENRLALLREWSDSFETEGIAMLLEEVNASLQPVDARPEVRQALLASWSRRDTAGLGEWFSARYAADELHQESRDALLAVLARAEPNDAFSWMRSALPDSAQEELYQPFLRNWTKRDPTAASAKMLELTKTETASPRWAELLGQTVGQWAKQDLISARNWTTALPSGVAKSKALEQLSFRWAEIDPLSAATYAATQNDPAALEAVASTWAASDPERAHSWAFDLPQGEGRNRAVAAVTAIWAVQTPATAAEYVESLPEGEEQNQARIVIATRWAETEALKAAKWTECFPENSAREQAAAQVVTTWAASDAKEAGRWLRTLPKSRSRDAAVLAYCGVIEASEPAAAFAWASSISDEPLRQQRQEKSATLWLAQNPAEARRGIANSTLPDDLKKQLLLGSN